MRVAVPRSAVLFLPRAQAGHDGGRTGGGGAGLPAAARALVARLAQRRGRPVAVLTINPPPPAVRGRGHRRPLAAVLGKRDADASVGYGEAWWRGARRWR